ncbi:ClpP family protease [uncultured Ruminococcus sp.]|uniref:ClpP family protease n=1 Tax=uncultured Ruminococcus sp. TaxID=165186 RepID=UPI0037DD15C7
MWNDNELPEENDNNESADQKPRDSVTAMGSVITHRGENIIYCLTVIGQIEGHYILPPSNKTTKYEHVIPSLLAIDEDEDIDGLLVLLNTSGGDVEAGLAIAEMIAGMKKPSVSLVLGGGHSIGIPLAVACDKSFIVSTASMTVHPVRTTGLTVGAPQTYRYFQKMQDRIMRFTVENSHISEEKYRELVLNTGELVTDIGTVLEGKEAVDCGLIDAVGTLHDATDALFEMITNSER